MEEVDIEFHPRISREMHIGSLHVATVQLSPQFVSSFVQALLQGLGFISLITALT